MRKNKKLLLASVAAMGALALGVGATSTFAWFQVTNGLTSTATNAASQSYSVNEVNHEITNVTIDGLTATGALSTAGSANLQLAHVVAKNTAEIANSDKAVAPYLTTGYVNNQNQFTDLGYKSDGTPNLASGGSSDVLYGTYTVTLVAKGGTDSAGNQWTADEVAKKLDGQTVTVSVTSTGRARVFKSDLSDAADDKTTTSFTISLTEAGLKSTGNTGTCCFFILGTNANGPDDGTLTDVGAISASVSASTNS